MSPRIVCGPSGCTVSQAMAVSCVPCTPALTGAQDNTSGISLVLKPCHIVLAILLSLMYVYPNKWSYVPLRRNIREIIYNVCLLWFFRVLPSGQGFPGCTVVKNLL